MGKRITVELSDELVRELGRLVQEGLYASEKEAIVAAAEEMVRRSQQEAEERRLARLRAFIESGCDPALAEPVSDEEWAEIKAKLAKNPPFKDINEAMRFLRGAPY